MERIQSIRQKARRRMMAPGIVSTIATPLVMLYSLVYIAALITTCAVGIPDPIGTATMFGLQGLETQLPLLFFLSAAWFICVLGDGLKVGAIFGCLPETLPLSGVTNLRNFLLRIAARLHGLASAKRLGSLALAGPAALFIASRTSLPPSLVTGWSPSIHPSLTYS